MATHQKRIAVVEELLARGADVNVSAKDGSHPLHLAVNNNSLELINLLVKYGDINARTTDENKVTALWLASQDGKLEIVKMLADLGADLNIIRATDGTSPMYVAMQKKQIAVVKELLARGADVNIPSEEGWYLWHGLSYQGFLDIMQLLFLKNPDINLKTADAGQYTALWLASQQGHIETVKWLAELGADVNIARQRDGTTALQTAIVNNHLPVIKVLVEECKADINKTNLDGASPLYYSLGYWHQAYKLAITKFLLEHNANIHAKTIFGDQPIHRASNLADVKAIKLLLDHGVSINEVNNDGNTPLHFLVNAENTAEVDKRLTAVKYLLERSASATIKNKEGKSAIDLAKDNFPEALACLEHPENLPQLSEFEATIIGLTDFSI
ncbi:ankyrin repeat domain-containing protein [Candidatus Tisiphia endosymbiont of Dascillus cervinus]|uniref:ankyrin repeat domain-containing protein n=1 Tax=Candidatus Tisiphia endosymbiont of Dascillus cervinus TaxID=3066253 RepID=UPI00312CBB5A